MCWWADNHSLTNIIEKVFQVQFYVWMTKKQYRSASINGTEPYFLYTARLSDSKQLEIAAHSGTGCELNLGFKGHTGCVYPAPRPFWFVIHHESSLSPQSTCHPNPAIADALKPQLQFSFVCIFDFRLHAESPRPDYEHKQWTFFPSSEDVTDQKKKKENLPMPFQRAI